MTYVVFQIHNEKNMLTAHLTKKVSHFISFFFKYLIFSRRTEEKLLTRTSVPNTKTKAEKKLEWFADHPSKMIPQQQETPTCNDCYKWSKTMKAEVDYEVRYDGKLVNGNSSRNQTLNVYANDIGGLGP